MIAGVMLAAMTLGLVGPQGTPREHTPLPPPGTRTPAPASWPAGTPSETRARLQKIWDQAEWEIYRKTDQYWHTGQYDHLARAGYVWIAMDPENLEAYSTTAFILESGMSMYPEAEKLHRQAVAVRPNDWRSWHDLVYFLYWQKRYAEALEPGERMLKLKPMTTAYHLVAHCYERSGNLEQSAATWRRAIAADKKDDVGRNNLKRVEELLDKAKEK